MFHILLPTDFSNNAQLAIDYAVYLFEKEDCTFHLLNAHYLVPSEAGTKVDAEHQLEQIRQKLEAAKNPKHQFEPNVVTDTAFSAINTAINDKNIDFVFIGNKGVSFVQELFMGSVTVSVVKHITNCPIITVPATYDYDIPDNILFASDLKHTFNLLELDPLIKIASLWDSTIDIVHINAKKELNDAQKSNKELLKKYLTETRHRFIQVKKKNSVVSTLVQLEENYKNIGMVALLKTERSFFEKLIREPVVNKLTFKAHVPLLVLPQV